MDPCVVMIHSTAGRADLSEDDWSGIDDGSDAEEEVHHMHTVYLILIDEI